MSLNRREFMWACGGTVAALAWGAGPSPGASSHERKVWMIPELTRELFEGYVGETFLAGPEAGPSVPLKLTKVVVPPKEACVDQKGRVCTETFIVVFEGAPEQILPQGIHTFRHDKMGEAAFFITPVATPSAGVRHYEVIFSQLVKS